MTDDDIEPIEELPETGRRFGERVAGHAERLESVEGQLATLGEITGESSTKEEKIAAILRFASNKRSGGHGKVALSPHEIMGCTGVSRRYAYELIEDVAERVEGVRMRDSETVHTGPGRKRKGKALLVDCENVHFDGWV